MKILIALMGLIAATGAFADSASGVAERVTCADIQAVINELSAVEEPDEETLAELDKQKMEYRRKCSRSAAKRKSSVVKNTVVAPTEMIEADTEPKEQVEEVVAEVARNEWKCNKCGKILPDYVGSCSCGNRQRENF